MKEYSALRTLINFTGMRRVWTCGINSTNKFMLGAATAYKLKKWLRYNVKNPNVKVMSVGRELERKADTLQDFFVRCKIS